MTTAPMTAAPSVAEEQIERANATDRGWREVADTALAFVRRFV